jgi:hypothetical protein
MSRALHGCVEVIVRDGVVWCERHRYDNRLSMAVLTRLDELAASPAQIDDAPRRVAHEFEAFVDAVCQGNDAASDFIRSRAELPHRAFDEAEIIARNAARVRTAEEGDGDEWQPSSSSTSLDLEGVGQGDGDDEWQVETSSTSLDLAEERGADPAIDDVLPPGDIKLTRHPRESGDPEQQATPLVTLGPRFRGDDGFYSDDRVAADDGFGSIEARRAPVAPGVPAMPASVSWRPTDHRAKRAPRAASARRATG